MRRSGIVSSITLLIAGAIALSSAQAQGGNEDYPLEALHKHQQGAVIVDVSVGTDGRVTGCSVVVSSKSPELDGATCKIFLTRGKFTPARNAGGQPTVDHVLGRIDWVIPGCKALPQVDPRLGAVQANVTITAVQGC